MTVSNVSKQNYYEFVVPTLKKRHAVIYELIAQAGQEGITSKEICDKLGKLPHQISGRFSEMVELKLIIVDRWVKIKNSEGKKTTFGVWVIQQQQLKLL